MQTLANMGLTSWDLAGDTFQRAQLHANWQAIDAHDHTAGKGLQIPTGGIANGAVTAAKIAAGAIQGSNIAAASIGDSALASPLNSSYKPVMVAQGLYDGTSGTFALAMTNGTILASTATTMPNLLYVPWVNADYAVSGMTTKLRVRYNWSRNTVASAGSTSITCNLRTLGSSGGSSGNITYTFGSAVLSSQAIINNPAASATGTVTSSDFTLADGNYFFSFTSPSISPAGWSMAIQMTLQVHHT